MRQIENFQQKLDRDTADINDLKFVLRTIDHIQARMPRGVQCSKPCSVPDDGVR